MNIFGITNCFLFGSNPSSQDEAHICHHYQAKNLARQVISLRGESTTIILFNEHHIKLTIDYVLDNSHDRKFQLQQIKINTLAYIWSRCKEQETMESQPLNRNLYYTPPISRRRYPCRLGDRKSLKVRGHEKLLENIVFRTQQHSCTHRLAMIVKTINKACSNSSLTNSSMERIGKHKIQTIKRSYCKLMGAMRCSFKHTTTS